MKKILLMISLLTISVLMIACDKDVSIVEKPAEEVEGVLPAQEEAEGQEAPAVEEEEIDEPIDENAVKIGMHKDLAKNKIVRKLLKDYEKTNDVKINIISKSDKEMEEDAQNHKLDLIITNSENLAARLRDNQVAPVSLELFRNDIYLLGPEIDFNNDLNQAFKKINEDSLSFLVTNKVERIPEIEGAVWKALEIDERTVPNRKVFDIDMPSTIKLANNGQSYVLADRANYILLKDEISIVPVVQDIKELRSFYYAMLIPADGAEGTHEHEADALVQFLLDEDTQKKVSELGVELYGEEVLVPVK